MLCCFKKESTPEPTPETKTETETVANLTGVRNLTISEHTVPIPISLVPQVPPIPPIPLPSSVPSDFIQVCTESKESIHLMPRTTLKGIKMWGYVTDVYDGDTLTLTYKNGKIVKRQFRMLGYDSPEMKPGLALENRALHVQAAKVARDKLKELLQLCNNFV